MSKKESKISYLDQIDNFLKIKQTLGYLGIVSITDQWVALIRKGGLVRLIPPFEFSTTKPIEEAPIFLDLHFDGKNMSEVSLTRLFRHNDQTASVKMNTVSGDNPREWRSVSIRGLGDLHSMDLSLVSGSIVSLRARVKAEEIYAGEIEMVADQSGKKLTQSYRQQNAILRAFDRIYNLLNLSSPMVSRSNRIRSTDLINYCLNAPVLNEKVLLTLR